MRLMNNEVTLCIEVGEPGSFAGHALGENDFPCSMIAVEELFRPVGAPAKLEAKQKTPKACRSFNGVLSVMTAQSHN